MTQELKEELKVIFTKLKEQKVAAVFIALNGKELHTLKNCDSVATSVLMVQHISTSPEMQEPFLAEMEKATGISTIEETEK